VFGRFRVGIGVTRGTTRNSHGKYQDRKYDKKKAIKQITVISKQAQCFETKCNYHFLGSLGIVAVHFKRFQTKM
jgi:hypothetical protein